MAYAFARNVKGRLPRLALLASVLLMLEVARAMAGGAGTAGATQTPAPTLLRAMPPASADNGSTATFGDNVTISPNGDSVNDAAQLVVCDTANARLMLRVFHWGHGRQGRRSWEEVYNSAPVNPVTGAGAGCGQRGKAVLAWHGQIGSTQGDLAPDTSYRVTVCTVEAARYSRARADKASGASVSETGARFLRDAGENIDDRGVVPASEADPAPGTSVKAAKGRTPDASELARPEGATGCIEKAVLVRVLRASIAISSTASFAPGAEVPLQIGLDAGRAHATVQIEGEGSLADAPITSVPASANRLPIPNILATGLYRVRLHVPAIDGRREIDRCVPLVVRSSSLNVNAPPVRTALIVWPYLTWRAYNQFDADGDGIPDTWYSRWMNRTLSLTGAYQRLAEKDGCNVVQPFTDWAQATPGRRMQSITDVELARMPQGAINRYSSIWFPDHSEYFEQAAYNKLLAYRAHHGNLVFLSANNFFRKVALDQRHNSERLVALQQRKDISTDFKLVGVGFDACCFPRDRFAEYTVGIGSMKAPWVLAGTNLDVGDEFGINGLEVDTLGRPYGAMHVSNIAQSTIQLKSGKDVAATMALIDWPGGGTTFATGNMVFTLMLRTPARAVIVSKILDNLWAHTTDEGATVSP